MQSHYLVKRDQIGFYRITVSGIDSYEETLPLPIFNSKLEERRLILETLLEPYNQSRGLWTNELMERIKSNDIYYLSSTVEYLEQKRLIKLQNFNGPKFYIKLAAGGFESLQDVTKDNARVMSNAYEILFRLENRLRQFIESRMRSQYGPDWWDNNVSHTIKREVNNLKQSESNLGWKVSESNNITDYILFGQLELIITNNWNAFQTIFHDQPKISHRLHELEGIRHSIAHTRILSQDGMVRLNQYSQDLLNMVESASS